MTRYYLERIDRLDRQLGAFVAVDAEGALRRAEGLDREVRDGLVRGPLHGVPLAYKDLCFIRGLSNACGLDAREADYFTAEADCHVARRLTEAGGVTLGKLAMTQLAMGTFGVNSGHRTPINPWATDRVPGGSSSGCAVAVASGLVPAAIGTDTGGSIRIPAACCGVVGLKPTFGRVDPTGIMPLSPSMDHVGPLARRVRDVGLLFSEMVEDAGEGAMSAWAATDVSGLRVAIASDDYFSDVSDDIATGITVAEAVLRDMGIVVERRAIRGVREMMDASATVVRAEAAARHGMLLHAGVRLDPLVRGRLEEGLQVRSAAYAEARATCACLREEILREVFGAVDVVLSPVIPRRPPLLAEAAGSVEDVVAAMAAFAKFGRFFNGLGIPVLSWPCGYTDGMPWSLQLATRPFEEGTLLAIGMRYEDRQPCFRPPPVA